MVRAEIVVIILSWKECGTFRSNAVREKDQVKLGFPKAKRSSWWSWINHLQSRILSLDMRLLTF